MKRPSLTTLTLATACALAISTVLPASAQSENASIPGKSGRRANGIYIVQMADPPAVAYAGGILGYKATRPNKGQKIDPNDRAVLDYAAYLDARHDAALGAAGGGRKVYGYHYAFNGFAAELNDAQAARMGAVPGVLSVEKDEARALDTSSTPTFLGLTGPDGFWNRKAKGENVIIGMVDGGVWPESLSFSDRTGLNGNATKDGKLSYQEIPGWHGKCTPGEAFNASMCNQKLIGAQYYNAGWGGNAGIDAQLPWEYNSPRDFGGHGTHTASTAGGNNNVPTTGAAAAFGSVSGIAPRARIAAYKVCWETGTGGSCFNSDNVAAIDQAVADGVDVINYSISGSTTSFLDSVEISFLYAAGAGVFVAASAGNSGPATSTVAHPGPWLTTVAAGTHNRNGEGSAKLGNGVTYLGASVAAAVSAPLIDSTAAGLAGADSTAVALCFAAANNGGTAVLDPARVAGKIVVCDRGVTARVDKSFAVQEAGGVGMILLNTSVNSLNADFHSVPTVHLQVTDRAAVKTYAATAGATATINKATIVLTSPAPFTASFSSRGPLRASGDLLKPDLIAPGQDILASVAPPGNSGRDFDLYSGTSMSSPHVAGLAALLKDLHPDWSPMMIKSALMTTGTDVLDGPNTNPVVIFRQGAGHVRPNGAADPGLVFDSGWNDWLGFLCGTQLPASFCTGAGIPVLDPSDFNAPSIAIGDLAGAQIVTRRVTNVGTGTATYAPSYTGMAGFNVVFSPSSLTLTPGQTKSFKVMLTRTTAALNAYTGGQLTWTDGTHNVRVPMVVRPVPLAAPAQVSGSYDVTFGYTGAFSAAGRGLVPATTIADTVTDDPTDTFVPGGPGTRGYSVAIPAGTTHARFSLFDANVSPASDLDLYLYNSAGTLVGASGGGTSAEDVNLVNPVADTYTVWVHGFGVAGTANFTLFTWVLGGTPAGNMAVGAPSSATLGTTSAINLSFSGLAPATKYLGSVAYSGAAGLPNPTIVRVDTP